MKKMLFSWVLVSISLWSSFLCAETYATYEWKSKSGPSIRAEFISLENDFVTLQKSEEQLGIKLIELSAKSQALAKDLQQAQDIVENVVDQILQVNKLPIKDKRTYSLMESLRTKNAMASRNDNWRNDPRINHPRVIEYNHRFILRLKDETNRDWAAIGLLAHEIGHHIAGHVEKGWVRTHEVELQADRFAGSTLCSLHATLDQAQSAWMSSLFPENATETHPGRNERLKAVKESYEKTFQELRSFHFEHGLASTHQASQAKQRTKLSSNHQVSSQGLLAYFPFNGNIKDASGNGHHLSGRAAINGTKFSFAQDRFGNPNNAGVFSREKLFLLTKKIGKNYKNFTVNLWFKTTSGGVLAAFAPNGKHETGIGDKRIYLGKKGILTSGIYQKGVRHLSTAPFKSYADGKWHNVALVQSNGFIYFFVDNHPIGKRNGQSVNSNEPGSWGLAFSNIRDDWPNAPPNPFFHGVIDDVLIFNRALSSNELSSIYNLKAPISLSKSAPAPSLVKKDQPSQLENPKAKNPEDGVLNASLSNILTGKKWQLVNNQTNETWFFNFNRTSKSLFEPLGKCEGSRGRTAHSWRSWKIIKGTLVIDGYAKYTYDQNTRAWKQANGRTDSILQ